MQNPYNNYLKRQKQQPINNFKEKVKNSLNGKAVNNTTMPNTTQANVVQNKVKAMTSNTGTNTNTVGTGASSGITTPVNTNVRVNTSNTPQTPLNASEVPSDVIKTPAITDGVSTTTLPTDMDVSTSGTGLMSLADINNTLSNTATNPNARNSSSLVYNPLNQNAIVPGTGGMTQAEYEAEVKRKQDAGIALDNPELYKEYLNQSTPYKYAEQILQSQKEQAEKNWQLQEQMMQQQQSALKQQYEQSKIDAENAYKESVDSMNLDRYNQMEALNASGVNRGIQYSPQQLGLENVANINHNKNLAEASKARNELLNKLQIEMNNSLAQLNMSHLQNYNSYQENIMKYQTDYYNQLMNWNREDSQTQNNRDWEQKLLEEKRKWEEEQAQKDKEFEQMMQELQNKFDQDMQNSQNQWQSGENALDREHDKAMASRSGGSGYSGGGYSSYSRSYNPYTYSYGGYGNYEVASSLDDEITQQAIDNTFKRLSTDAYNAVDTGGVSDLEERADLYNEYISDLYNEYYGQNDVVDERLDNTRSTALKHLLNKSYARSTNGTYQIGDTVYTHNSPLRQDYIDKVKKTQAQNREKYYNKYNVKRDELTKSKMKTNAIAENIHNKIMDNVNKNKTSNKSNSKNTPTRKTNINETQKKVTKAVNNSTKNVKKSTSNAIKNVKKNTNTKTNSSKTQKALSNSKKNTTKSLNNSKKNTKKSKNNSLKNLKKNISKLFGK